MKRAYLDRFPLTPAQRKAILTRDWNGMLAEGGNIYFTAKLAATDGLSFQQIAAKMTGSTQEDYAAMMLAGGRSIAGNRSKKENRPVAEIVAGIATSHVPAIGAALDNGKADTPIGSLCSRATRPRRTISRPSSPMW